MRGSDGGTQAECSRGRETSEGTVSEGNREELVGGQLYRKKERKKCRLSWVVNSVCVCHHRLLADGLAEDARGNA